MKKSSLSIILPCYNPGDQWEQLVIGYFESLAQRTTEYLNLNLVIVNDGSSKKLDEPIKTLRTKFPDLEYIHLKENKGKGNAIRSGLSATTSDYFLYTDIDFPYTESSIIKMVNILKNDKQDICIGVRGPNYYENLPFVRRWISSFLKGLNRIFFNLKTSDTQAGLKGFNQKGKTLFLETKTDRFLVDLEFLSLLSKRKDIQTSLLPIELREGIQFSSFNFSILLGELASFAKILFR